MTAPTTVVIYDSVTCGPVCWGTWTAQRGLDAAVQWLGLPDAGFLVAIRLPAASGPVQQIMLAEGRRVGVVEYEGAHAAQLRAPSVETDR